MGKACNIIKVRNSIIPQSWRDHTNLNHCSSARIWVCWKDSLLMAILGDPMQHVHCKIIIQGKPIFVTICSGVNDLLGIIDLWESLRICGTTGNSPWYVMGDFNSTRWESEKLGGSKPSLQSLTNFNDCIDDCGSTFPFLVENSLGQTVLTSLISLLAGWKESLQTLILCEVQKILQPQCSTPVSPIIALCSLTFSKTLQLRVLQDILMFEQRKMAFSKQLEKHGMQRSSDLQCLLLLRS